MESEQTKITNIYKEGGDLSPMKPAKFKYEISPKSINFKKIPESHRIVEKLPKAKSKPASNLNSKVYNQDALLQIITR